MLVLRSFLGLSEHGPLRLRLPLLLQLLDINILPHEDRQHRQRHNRHASNQDQPLNISLRVNDSVALQSTIGIRHLNDHVAKSRTALVFNPMCPIQYSVCAAKYISIPVQTAFRIKLSTETNIINRNPSMRPKMSTNSASVSLEQPLMRFATTPTVVKSPCRWNEDVM